MGEMMDQWQRCYSQGWGKNLCPEAFSHPAKISFKLAERIYAHAIENHWIEKEGLVLDPFGGICGFGYHAMANGLNFIGIELEEKFVKLGEQNIDLWNRQLKGWPNLGTARIVQGDSKRLKEIFRGMSVTSIPAKLDELPDNVEQDISLIVSSPPFQNQIPSQASKEFHQFRDSIGKDNSLGTGRYISPDNLANLPEGSLQDVIEKADIVISSPPYSDEVARDRASENYTQSKNDYKRGGKSQYEVYGHTLGNLANLKEGKFEMVISSPVYPDSRQGWNKPNGAENIPSSYGDTIGQLGSMKEGSFDLCVSSPPYEEGASGQLIKFKNAEMFAEKMSNRKNKPKNDHGASKEAYLKKMERDSKKIYGESENQLGNSSGDTFWSASREIVQQCFDLFKDGGHAIWVCKDYVKAKKRVPFSDRWLTLCELVGFRLVCRHQAMLVKSYGKQVTINGEDEEISVERKSFFRRLAESKGSPKIDWEDILCLVK